MRNIVARVTRRHARRQRSAVARSVCLLALAGALGGCGADSADDGARTDGPYQFAVAELAAVADSGVTGTVRFNQGPETLDIEGSIDGLAAGRFRLQVHAIEDCDRLDDGAAGPVFSPDEDVADLALDPDLPNEAGNLGAIEADASGATAVDLVATRVTIGPGDTSILGKVLVVHERLNGFDAEGRTALAGDAIACGPIQEVAARKYVP